MSARRSDMFFQFQGYSFEKLKDSRLCVNNTENKFHGEHEVQLEVHRTHSTAQNLSCFPYSVKAFTNFTGRASTSYANIAHL